MIQKFKQLYSKWHKKIISFNSAGFTLIELLVVIAIFVILVIILMFVIIDFKLFLSPSDNVYGGSGYGLGNYSYKGDQLNDSGGDGTGSGGDIRRDEVERGTDEINRRTDEGEKKIEQPFDETIELDSISPVSKKGNNITSIIILTLILLISVSIILIGYIINSNKHTLKRKRQ